jgi:putative phage-type endonuclease
MKQQSEEWFNARLGLVTASRIIDIMPSSRGYRASRDNYIAQLVCERLTGQREESFTNSAMQWGTDNEPLARAAYEAVTGVIVDEVGFIKHPEITGLGASPDGLVGSDGCIEIKCPNTATHLRTYLKGEIKKDYIYQMQTVMMCAERDWCDFVSYDPRLPDKYCPHIIRVERDEKMIDDIITEVESVLIDIEQLMEDLK